MKINTERDIDVENLLYNIDGVISYNKPVDNGLLRDTYDLITYLMNNTHKSDIIASKDYKVLIELKELENKIINAIDSGELDKLINNTIFAGKSSEFKDAIIHGLAIASIYAGTCEKYIKLETET